MVNALWCILHTNYSMRPQYKKSWNSDKSDKRCGHLVMFQQQAAPESSAIKPRNTSHKLQTAWPRGRQQQMANQYAAKRFWSPFKKWRNTVQVEVTTVKNANSLKEVKKVNAGIAVANAKEAVTLTANLLYHKNNTSVTCFTRSSWSRIAAGKCSSGEEIQIKQSISYSDTP